MPGRQFRPNEVSSGGVVVRASDGGGYEVCLVSDGRYWGLPKGNVERREAPPEAALREIAEETGISRQGLGVVAPLPASDYVYRRDGRTIFKRVHWFLVTAPAGSELVPQPEEIDEAAWLSFADAKERASHPDTVKALDEAERILATKREASA